jgi:hypothetical protein
MAIQLRPEQLRKDFIKSLHAYKKYFECNWDYDADLLSSDEEREHYSWTIKKLGEMGEQTYPNYNQQIEDWENKLPYD